MIGIGIGFALGEVLCRSPVLGPGLLLAGALLFAALLRESSRPP